MAKLYYKFGVMGSSKTASALMCRFNYMQKNQNVLLLKPNIDNRYKVDEVTSRIGLSAPCLAFAKDDNLLEIYKKENEKAHVDVVIVDECQFSTKKQIEQLREISEEIPVLCYGLKTNYKGELFDGSKRLLEICDSISEIKSICECGKKAIMNALFVKGFLVYSGDEVVIGGDEKYKGMCYSCYKKAQEKSMMHNRITEFLKTFKGLESAGDWNSDTTADNIILQVPEVIYSPEVQDFMNYFKEKEAPAENIDATLVSLKKQKPETAKECLSLISLAIKNEKDKPGLVKSLIESGIISKWLKIVDKSLA